MKYGLRLVALIGLSLTVAACHPGVDGKRIEAASASDWLSYGRTYDEQRFSPLDQITPANVGRLGVAWWAQFDTDRGQEATPLIADGVLYTSTAWSKVFAFDAKTGKQLWSYDPKVAGEKGFNACCDVVNRGVALWQGKVYVGTLDGRLVALDGKTGEEVWSVQTTDPAKPYTITGAPRVIKGKVLIGNGGAEYGVRGYVTAYDADSGRLAWRFYMTPNPTGAPDGAASDKIMAAQAGATWSDGVWKTSGGGGAPWDAITYDAKTDLVFVGGGNGSPWNHKLRSGGKGDNLFLSSIVALKPETGEYVWHYQTTPGESWDYTATQHIMVADLPIDGQVRHVVMQAPKNGFFYVLDAASGHLLSAEKFVPADWAERIDLTTGRPVEDPAARYPDGQVSHQTPSSLGGHNWQPMAFNPKLGLVYIPTMTIRGNFSNPEQFTYLPGAWNTGQGRPPAGPAAALKAPPKVVAPPPRPASGELIAWDPVAQTARWRVHQSQPWTSGVLATAGGLVFHASGHAFSAHDATTGAVVWSYDVGANAVAAASTYAIDGEQYVALMVGAGGAGGKTQQEPRQPGRLLVFKIGGTTKPPPLPAPITPRPLNLAAADPTKGDADRGGTRFGQLCGTCHTAGAFLPNLPRSPAILSEEGFREIVLDGSLRAQGMASFKPYMDAAGVEDIRAFLLWQAKTPPVPAAPAAAEPNHGQ